MRVLGAVLLVGAALTGWGSSVLAAQDVSATNRAHQISVGDSVQAVQKALEIDAAPSRTSSSTTEMKLRSESAPVACACFAMRLELQSSSGWTRHFGAALKARQLAHRVMTSVTD
jgi:hypothetical protein